MQQEEIEEHLPDTPEISGKSEYTYINDQWTLEDQLGMGRAGDELSRLILEAHAPFTIGVTGKWGSGKTSILRRAYATLGGEAIQQSVAFDKPRRESIQGNDLKLINRDPPLKWLNTPNKLIAEQSCCVWFSPWQHQNEQNPLIPLLLEIQNLLKHHFGHGDTNEFYKKCRQGALAASTLVERLIDVTLSWRAKKNIKVASGTVEAVRNAWQQADDGLTQLSDGQRFHLLFEDAVEQVLYSIYNSPQQKKPSTENDIQYRSLDDNARLVIFIDDLDRCEESLIISLLEAIKLYLHSKRCIFVLGIDEKAVLDALGRHWQRSEDMNREYLEKLFQARIQVPLPCKDKIKALIFTQLVNNQIHVILAKTMATHVTKLIEPNPRKVKNFVNGLVARWHILAAKDWPEFKLPTSIDQSLAQSLQSEPEASRFVLFFYLQQYHSSIWRLLERQPSVLKYLRMVLNGESRVSIPDNQRMLWEMFYRAFSHVLADKTGTSTNGEYGDDLATSDDKHGGQSLDDAVSDFIQRQDRKVSDEYMLTLFEQFIDKDMELESRYLIIDNR